MTIRFDIFVLLPEMEAELKLDERLVFDEIVSFFEQRLSPLKDEIEAEEITNSDSNSALIIHLLPPKEQWELAPHLQDQKIRITTQGYSATLKQKMEASFNNNDFILLNNKLDAIAQRFRN